MSKFCPLQYKWQSNAGTPGSFVTKRDLFFFLCIPVWNMDVIPGVPGAILDQEVALGKPDGRVGKSQGH